MKIATDELDRRIIAVLKGGEQILSDLAINACCDARDILKRLHVLAGSKQVQCSKHDGSLFWALGVAEGGTPKEDPPPRASQPAVAPATEERDPAPGAQAPTEEPHRARRRRQNRPIVVRPAVYVPELRVVRLGPEQVLIEEVHPEDPNRENDGVAVNTNDLPALIHALTSILEEAA